MTAGRMTSSRAGRCRIHRAALAAALLAASVGTPALQGQPRELQGLRGGTLGQRDLAQGRTVMVFFAGWSPRCRNIVERVNALQDRWGDRARVVAVNFQEERGEVERFLAGKRLAVPVFLDRDGAFAKRHAVTTLPGLLVVVDGSVSFSGKLDADADRVLAGILR